MARSRVGNESGQMKTRRAVTWFVLGVSILAAALLFAEMLLAETPSANSNGLLQLTATTANVIGAPDPVRIEILRWSTDEERERLMAAWEPQAVRQQGQAEAEEQEAGKSCGQRAGAGEPSREQHKSGGLAREGSE